ncbi:MAG TPA: polyprenyl synthetase family protein [Candidatus Methylomirabilis sp.]|nr:polyprenyl synthetase family protein [Candidatus Methylomirabilis sp.]
MTKHADFAVRFPRIFNDALSAFIRERAAASDVRGIGSSLLRRSVAAFVRAPGKRLRPYIAYRSAISCGAPRTSAMSLAIAVELFHAFALVHDDLIDRSNVRRGRATLHRAFEAKHRTKRWNGSAAEFGEAMAVLAGDLLVTWADASLRDAMTPTNAKRVLRAWDGMREEVILGQSLDVCLPRQTGLPSRAALMRMLAVKSGRYSIGRPALLGLALAGRNVDVQTVLRAAEPLGLAFQLQDDILGTFGSARRIGKPTDSDIREGKWTLLAWETRRRIRSIRERHAWRKGFGIHAASSRDVHAVRLLMEQSGAREEVERLATRLTNQAMTRIERLPFKTDWLTELAKALMERRS